MMYTRYVTRAVTWLNERFCFVPIIANPALPLVQESFIVPADGELLLPGRTVHALGLVEFGKQLSGIQYPQLRGLHAVPKDGREPYGYPNLDHAEYYVVEIA